MDLCYSHRAENLDHRYLDASEASSRIMLMCTLPLTEIVTDFYDKLKSRSSGFASFESATLFHTSNVICSADARLPSAATRMPGTRRVIW